MPELYRTRPYELDKIQKYRLDAKYTRFEVNNKGPYELLVKFNHDETNWSNPDTMVKPWATQTLVSDYKTDRIMFLAESGNDQSADPDADTPKFSFLASDTGFATAPAYTSVGLLQALKAEVEEVSPTLINMEEAADYRVAQLGVTGDAYYRVEIANTGDLYIGDGTVAPVSVGRVAGLDDIGDFATTGYVDTGDAAQVSKSGDSMSGALDMNGNAIRGVGVSAADGAVPKSYVDDGDARNLSLSGGIMTGVLDMNNRLIDNVGAPQSAGDAARIADVRDGDAATLSDANAYTDTRTGTSSRDSGSEPVSSNFSETINVISYAFLDGFCIVEGQVQNVSGGTLGAGTLIMTLASDRYPRLRQVTACALATTSAWSDVAFPVSVNEDGTVRTERALTADFYVHLSLIFRTV